MRPLSKEASRVLNHLVDGLDRVGDSRRFDNSNGTYLAACVEHIGPNRFSVAHYVEQGGDLLADPDIEFVRWEGIWFPAAITQAPVGKYVRVLETDGDGKPTGLRPRGYQDLLSFASLLLRNIKEQQGLRISRERKAS